MIQKPICVLLLISLCTLLMAEDAAPGAALQVTHILGFGDIANNANGDLSIQAGTLRFQKKDGGQSAQINLDSIQKVSTGQQDRQMGGKAAAVGRAATPYGGGRVIALFSHKKYDTVTLEYLDANGGFHGAIFQLNKGQGQVLRDQLPGKSNNLEIRNDGK
jgi:hypothetical protein